MKKLTVLILAFVLVLSLAACTKVNEIRDIAETLKEAVDDISGGIGEEAMDDIEGGIGEEADTTEKPSAAVLSEKIVKTFYAGEYHMVIKTAVAGMEIISDGYYKDGMTATTTETMGIKVTAILKGGKAYTLMHDAKMYMVIPISEYQESANNEMYFEDQIFTGSGKAVFDGKERVYEEYTYDKKNYIRYFFDGDNFIGIAIKTADGTFMEMVILSFDTTVPAGVFDIPAGYTDMSGMFDGFGN